MINLQKDFNNNQLNTLSQKRILTIRINCRFTIKNWTLDIEGLIDTRSSNCILDEKLVPLEYHQTIPDDEQFSAEQIDGKLFKYTKQ